MIRRILFFGCFCLLLGVFWACGDEKNGEIDQKQRERADSIRKARDEAFNKASDENRRKALEDSIQAEKEFNARLAEYDSLRAVDSLKVKRKHHPPVKPAPKRELGGRSPVK